MRPALTRLNHYGLDKLTLSSSNHALSSVCQNVKFTNDHHGNSLSVNATRPFSSTRLAEVGKFKTKQSDESCYPPGQPFLHRIFGYRGVTLFPWLARVHDIDLRKQYTDDGLPSSATNVGGPESQKKYFYPSPTTTQNNNPRSSTSSSATTNDCHPNDDPSEVDGTQEAYKLSSSHSITRYHPYYQVLIDTRDCPYVSNRTQTEAVTFLGHPDNSKSVYSIKGLDYVAHEDILPYTSHEDQPIHHELHNKLFKLNPDAVRGSSQACSDALLEPKFSPSELLESWKSKHPWLELSRVYRETTENVRVTVIPFYLGHTTIEDTSFHWWRYCVRLENLSDISVQLRERHWKIFSQTNMLQTIKGRGVVGVEPLLSKSEPAYQYSSHVNLQDKSGHMWGTFKMQREDGHTFECKIPPFSLESSIDITTPPNSKRRSPTNQN